MASIQANEKAEGLICPSCSGVVPIIEGTRIVRCPYCGTHSLIQGDRGIKRWQIRRKLDRAGAEAELGNFLSGVRKARDLRHNAKVSEVLLAYVPFWRVDTTVAGWLFGRVPSGDDDTKPAEFSVFEPMHWNDAALDVGDLAINRITVDRADLMPFDSQQVYAEAMVFDPTESATEALNEAQSYFVHEANRKSKQKTTYYQNIQLLSPTLTLAYYPVWIVRYLYRERTYQVTIDAVNGAVIAGRAPGSTLYRAAVLVSSLAAGTFILVNGSILLLASGITDDDGFALFLLPIIVGLLIIFWGYRNFRYGEEVEDRREEYGKAGQDDGLLDSILVDLRATEMFESGKATLLEISKAQRKVDNDQ